MRLVKVPRVQRKRTKDSPDLDAQHLGLTNGLMHHDNDAVD